MQTLTKLLVSAGLADRVVTERQLARLVDGSNQRRYHLVNRAIKNGELSRVRRGLYVLTNQWRDTPCHPNFLAQMLVPGSYVSLESALSFHGWIPEAVFTTTSILPGRKAKEYSHDQFGLFTFQPLALERGHFLQQVERVTTDKQNFLMASPLRGLTDLVCLKKVEWQGLVWIEQNLRIESNVWPNVSGTELRALKQVYKHKRVKDFISKLEISLRQELNHE